MARSSRQLIFAVLLGLLLPFSMAFANTEAPQVFTYEGRLYNSSDEPLSESVTFKLQILNQAENCLLYEESQVVDLSSSEGRFALEIGSAAGASKRTTDDPGFSMWQVFKNTGSLAVPAGVCPGTPYNPSLGEKRKLRVSVTPASTGVAETLSPNQTITSAPSSMMSQSLQGVGKDGFIQVVGSVTQADVESLLDGSDIGSAFHHHDSVYAKVSGSGSMTFGAGATLGFGAFDNTQETALVGGLAAGDAGKTWFNSDTGFIMYWDGDSAEAIGTSGTGIISLNGHVGTIQTFPAPGTSGTSPSWDFSTANQHKLNIPLASTAGVVAGLLSNTDYATFSSKLSDTAVPNAAGDIAGNYSAGLTIQNDAVTSSMILDGQVDTADLTDGAVTLQKMDATGAAALQAIRRNSGNTAWEYYTPTDTDTTYTADGNGIELSATTFSIELNGNTLNKGASGLSVDQANLDHGSIGGLTDDDHSQYLLLAGRAGGQTLAGGSNAGDDLSIDSTNNATKGSIFLQPSGGNVGIGTVTPNASALLDVSSTTKGFLPPRMTEAERDAISSPATGLQVYNLDDNKLNLYNGSTWTEVGGGNTPAVVVSPIKKILLTSFVSSSVRTAIGEVYVRKSDNTNLTTGAAVTSSGTWVGTTSKVVDGVTATADAEGYYTEDASARLMVELTAEQSDVDKIEVQVFASGGAQINQSLAIYTTAETSLSVSSALSSFCYLGELSTGAEATFTKSAAPCAQNINANVLLADTDLDTKIQLEESADEDTIRFDTAGTERMTIAANGSVTVTGGLSASSLSGDGSGLTNIGASAIADGSISASKIADNSISVEKLDFASANGITLPALATPPGSPVAGQVFYDSDDKKLMIFDGSNWVDATEVGSEKSNLFTGAGQSWTAQNSAGIASVTVDAVNMNKGRIKVKVDDVTVNEVFPGQQFFGVYEAVSSIVLQSAVEGFDVLSAVLNDTFSIAAQEVTPQGIAFSNDGLKMFVVGSTGDDVNEYSLSVAFDSSTGTFVDSFSVAAQETGPTDIAFSGNGKKMYIIGTTGDDVNEYHLTTAFDVSTASYIQRFPIASTGELTPRALAFSADGKKMFILGDTLDTIFEYSLSIAWDISTSSIANSFSVTTEETVPQSLAFSPSGLTMFVLGSTGDDVSVYTLTAPYNITTAFFLDIFSVAADETVPAGIAFSNDGRKMFVIGQTGDDVNEYNVSGTGRLISSLAYSDNFSVATEETVPESIRFSSNGLKMFVLGSTGDDVNEYSMTDPYDLSTATFVTNFSVATEETVPTGLSFNSSGTKMFVVGQTGDDVNEYSLSTAFDISTASFVTTFSVAAQETAPEGIAFNSNGTKMFVLGSTGDDINEYILSTGFDVSTATFNTTFSVAAQETVPTDIVFNSDGTRLFIVGQTGDDVNEYKLATPFDVSTASFSGRNVSVLAQETAVNGLAFNSSETKVFVIGSTSDSVHEYKIFQETEFLGTALATVGGASGGGSGKLIADSDNDTYVTVEASADDDSVRLVTSGSERVTVTSGGNVGVGTTTPDEKFVVNNGSTIGKYTTSGWTHSSDRRLKEDIHSIQHPLEKILRLQGVEYVFKSDPERRRQVGFIAQDVETIFPEVVDSDGNGLKTMVYGNLVAPLVEAVKEVYGLCEMSKGQVESYQSEIFELKDKGARQELEISNLVQSYSNLRLESQQKDMRIRDLEERLQKIERSLANQE